MAHNVDPSPNASALLHLPEDPYTTFDRISAALQSLQRPKGPYVHPRVIAYPNTSMKTSWIPYFEDAAAADVIGDFLRAPKRGKTAWLGFFSGPSRNWVGRGDKWTKDPWHCFAALVVSDSKKGKHLIIYDNDAEAWVTEDSRISVVLCGLQRNLHDQLRERHKEITVWYSKDTTHAGTERCLRYAIRKAREWSLTEDGKLQYSDDEDAEVDPRVRGYVRLRKR